MQIETKKKAGVAILISDKMDFKTKAVKRNKEGHYIMIKGSIHEVQFSSVAQSCPTLSDPMNCSTSGLPVHHQLPEFTQTHIHQVGDSDMTERLHFRFYVHWIGDAIQPSHPVVPFSSCPQSLPASESFPMSQLFPSGGQSTGVSALASFLPKNTQGPLKRV